MFLVRCVLEFRCGWVGVVSVLQASPHRNSNTYRTKNNMTDVVIQQNSRKLLMMDILMSETCWAHKKWNKIASDIKLVFYSSTIKMMHGPINVRSVMELGHLLTRSGLTYPEVSSKFYHDSFCQSGSSVSLPWVIYFGAFYLRVVSSFSCIPVICPKIGVIFNSFAICSSVL